MFYNESLKLVATERDNEHEKFFFRFIVKMALNRSGLIGHMLDITTGLTLRTTQSKVMLVRLQQKKIFVLSK